MVAGAGGGPGMSASTPPIAKRRQRFVDVLAKVPKVTQTPQVDYLFVGGDLEVIEAHLRDDGASDHPAVIATLR